MLVESDARALLSEHKIERDLLETRSCAEIVTALGLLSANDTLELQPVTSESGRLQAENMTRNVRLERPPYFVR